MIRGASQATALELVVARQRQAALDAAAATTTRQQEQEQEQERARMVSKCTQLVRREADWRNGSIVLCVRSLCALSAHSNERNREKSGVPLATNATACSNRDYCDDDDGDDESSERTQPVCVLHRQASERIKCASVECVSLLVFISIVGV